VRKLLALVFSGPLLAISILTLSLITSSFVFTPANAAPNSIEINSISEVSCTSVEILFESSVPKKSLVNYVITAAVDPSVGQPKNIKKIIKTKATGLITTEIKNLNPKVAYKFSVSAKTNKGKMINSEAVEHISLCDLMDKLSNLPADWGNPKPIPTPVATPVAAPAAAPIAAPAFTLSSSSETRTVNTAATGFTINSTGGAIASFAISATPAGMSFSTSTGALSGTPTSVAGATTYTITATNATGSATQTFALTVTAVVYTVGQRGPGGGIVYYVSDNYFTSTGSTCNTECKYLEVAPATWQSAGVSVANDSTYQWSTNTTALTGQDITTASTEGIAPNADEKLNWKIGRGFNNTSVMKVSGAASAAQAAVLAYAGSATAGQWFIPSMNELNELCKYARGQTTGDLKVACDTTGTLKTGTANDLGGFVVTGYWSSSESTAILAWGMDFSQGNNYRGGKTNSYSFRPVRAF
jgi:hypothetical protein